ncbi:MAG: RICIN domain-containing protein, partial [Bradymonadaceae bacterium]
SDNYILVNKSSGKVLNAEGNTWAPDRNVGIVDFDETFSAVWTLYNTSGDDFYLRNNLGGHDLGVDGASQDGASVKTVMGGGNTSAGGGGEGEVNEEWKIEAVEEGYFSLIHKTSGKALSLSGDDVVQEGFADLDGQKWAIHVARASREEAPNFELFGFATQNGGTTGGEGGVEVVVSTPAEFMDAIVDPERPKIIKISGTIDLNTINTGDWTNPHRNQWGNRVVGTGGGPSIRPSGDLSLIGIGNDAEIRGIELRLGPSDGSADDPKEGNYIVRNIKFTQDAFRSEQTAANISETAIILSSRVGNVWIDHCEFEDHPDHPDPDGGIDIHSGAKYITISWNIFNKGKVNLWGSDNVGEFDDPQGSGWLTAHHNWWPVPQPNLGTASRTPLMMLNRIHLLNNYWESEYGGVVRGRVENGGDWVDATHLLEEGNYKSSNTRGVAISRDVVIDYANMWGEWDIKNSLHRRRNWRPGNAEWEQINGGINWDPAQEYDYRANHALNVPELVLTHAGRGRGPFAE